MSLSSNHYYTKTLDYLNNFEREDVRYTIFKWFCAIYVWNYKVYKSISTIFDKKTYKEPLDPRWINLLQIEYGSLGYKNTDSYHMFDTMDKDTMMSYYTTYIETQKHRQEQSDTLYIPETLFMMKMDNQYICHGCNEPKVVALTCEKSNVEFLYVDYNHPKMEESIELHVPESFYICGNVLLSCAFVLRLLEMQPMDYVYDDKYFLNVLDHNMEKVQLTMHNYIELSEDAYKVKKNNYIARHLENELLQKEIDDCEITLFPIVVIQMVRFLEKFSFLFQFLVFISSFIPWKKQRIQPCESDPDESDPDESDPDESELGKKSDTDESETGKSENSQSFEIIDNKHI